MTGVENESEVEKEMKRKSSKDTKVVDNYEIEQTYTNSKGEEVEKTHYGTAYYNKKHGKSIRFNCAGCGSYIVDLDIAKKHHKELGKLIKKLDKYTPKKTSSTKSKKSSSSNGETITDTNGNKYLLVDGTAIPIQE